MKRFLGLGAAVALALSALSPVSADENKRVKIINETTHNIVQFYASRVGTNDWEEDILDVDILPPGDAVTISFANSDFCLYDFKAVFDDNDTLVRNRINVCEAEIYRYSEE
jgi:hypothetical protein